MAHHLVTILGNMLAPPLQLDEKRGSLAALPSPEDLKGKIIIKAKRGQG